MSASRSIGVVCYASLGGSGIVASELAAGLAARGHAVHLIASAPPQRGLPAESAGMRLTFHAVPVSSHPVLAQPLYGLALAETIVTVGRRHALDLLHVHYAVPHAASAHLARAALGAAAPRLVTTLHGSDVTGYGVAQSYEAITRFTVAASDGLTVPSAFLRQEAHERLGLAVAAIEVMPNFVDTARFAPVARRERGRFAAFFAEAEERDAVMLVHVSNFRAVKRVGDLLDVLAIVRRARPARLVLVGDGPERPMVAERARALGLAAHVAFVGPRADFADHLPHADAFLFPSATESFGVAALEALSAGVPVIAYRVGGLPDVIGDAGALVAPFDRDAFAHAVLAVVGDPVRRAALGATARGRAVDCFGRELALDRWEHYFERVLARPRGATS